MRPRWDGGPATITLVRHGESVANVADARARERHADHLGLDGRDADVELSATGRRQADALAGWLAGAEESLTPTVVLSSPFRRAAETAARVAGRIGLEVDLDERLRERDLGVLDGLTGLGIRERHPEEAARRKKLGKFYYTPPSGESWADVVLRVRSLLQDLRVGYDGERIWAFTHQAVIMSFRYALEGLAEEDLLRIDREVQIPNASITRFRLADDGYELEGFADTTAVDQGDAEVTRERSQRGRGHEHA